MTQLKRWITLLLAVAMLLGMSACGRKASQTQAQVPATEEQVSAAPEEEATPVETTEQAQPETQPAPTVSEVTADEDGNVVLPVDTTDRESLEQIVELLGSDKKPGKLDDKELGELAEDLLEDLENDQKTDGIVDLETQDQPTVDFDESAYDEDGAITKPFDQVYPELVESGEVEYDDETLLIKMKNSRKGKITDGMKKAGVAALEVVVPMEDTTWYEAKLKKGTEAAEAVEALRKLKEVLLVEYNYEVQPASIDSYQALPTGKGYENNSLVADQWYLNHCGIPAAMENLSKPGGDSSVIVAVIDSGVDYDHEDLKENIWVNKNEIPDNGIDDDNNGYIDDYYGVDIVAGKGNGDDNHGHGTHVAGIIAAQNNNMGTLGIAYNVKIMPIKAGSAYLLNSDIAKAVYYAYENGAEVINMSFGGSASSIAVQDALATAFTRCVLVASAGNDGAHNEGAYSLPNYPAALTYVLGVMSIDQAGRESAFTNYDVLPFSGVEYELYAPGDGIMSTLPNDQYGILSGTSMAAPVVSAMAAILRSEYSDRNTYPTRFIYGQLTSTSGYCADCLNPALHGSHNIPQVADLNAALTKMPKPELGVQDNAYFDTVGFSQDEANANNGDGVLDAGETVALGLTLRNRWGQSKDTLVSIDTNSGISGMADPYVEILTNDINYGSVGTYATGDCGQIFTDEIITGWENPFYLRISKDCPNDYAFTLNVTITCGNGMDETDTESYVFHDELLLKVRSGVILPQSIDQDMTLTKDNLYIIPNATVIEKGVTVTVEPGTRIQFWSNDANDPYASNYMASLRVNGTLMAEGTKEEPIEFFPGDGMDNYVVQINNGDGKGYVCLRYAKVVNLYQSTISYAEHCNFTYNYNIGMYYRSLHNGVVNENQTYNGWMGTITKGRYCSFYGISDKRAVNLNGTLDSCIFADSAISFGGIAENCVFLGNYVDTASDSWDTDAVSTLSLYGRMDEGNVTQNPAAVYYRPETGTTYLYAVETASPVRKLVQALGGDYAIFEDEEEFAWFLTQTPMQEYNALGIGYDHDRNCFTWHDGSDLGDFLNAESYLKTARPDQVMGIDFKQKTLVNVQDTYTGYDQRYFYLYEIPGEILPTDITFTKYETVLDMDATYQIVPFNKPVQLPADMFIYESSDEAVLKVSDTGLVTPVALGAADVTVYSKDRAVWNHISFEVKEYVALESLAFTRQHKTVAIGETCANPCLLQPADTTRQNVVYSSSDESVVTVDVGGNLTGIGSGTATVTATCEGFTAEMTVTVYKQAAVLEFAETFKLANLTDAETLALPELNVSKGAEVALSWSSSDESVAKIVDEGIQLVAPGVTSIIVTDANSGKSAEQTLYVTQQKLPKIVDLQVDSNCQFVLTESGDLYHWSNNDNYKTPKIVAQNVVSFDNSSNEIAVLRTDGTVTRYFVGSDVTEYETYTLSIADPVQIAWYNDTYLALTADGSVYGWGENSYGQLGLGYTGRVEEPAMVNLDAMIVQVEMLNSAAAFLTETGDLYIAGGSGMAAYDPVLVAQKVTDLHKTSYDRISYLAAGQHCAFCDYQQSPDSFSYYDQYDLFFADLGNPIIAVKDNKISYCRDYFDGQGSVWKTLPGTYGEVTSVVCNSSQAFYFTTEDGLLFGFGQNGSNQLGGAVSGNSDLPVMIPLGLSFDAALTLNGTNLGEENLLTEDTLVLEFNKHLQSSGSVKLYADGTQISVTATRQQNKLLITRSAGFKSGVSYTLTVANNLTGTGGAAMAEDLQLSFTYRSEFDLGETVIHEAQTDASVWRYWDVSSLNAKLTELDNELQIHKQFSGNAVLNRVSTDTDVQHWLRPLAQGSEDIPLSGNWWGTTNETAINLQLIDATDFADYGKFIYKPYLTEAPSNTFPFVTDVKVFGKDGKEVKAAGMEEVTVRVTFNRDMDTSIPLNVMFGSAYPYADYEITEGEYINKRTWEGKYFISSVMGNGYQYFSIGNGQSATDDLELFTDRMRFAFQVDTTAAQALLMQGYATDTGIQLSWTQDDFDTLMGYNVYRSDAEDGLYTRVNQTVIPAGTMEFFDDTVEPGKLYYYNFTVVQSDMTESAPSGKINLMSKDTMAPNIYHSPVYEAFTGENLIISATVTDNLNIAYTKVYYRTTGTTTWKTSQMNNLNDKYSAIIPAADVTTAGLEYYLEAFDGISCTYKGSAEAPYSITVKKAVTKDSLGDVNGDGKISNLDALMLLQAINDLLNLDSEQFMRADLNGNGILEAREALRILQYVSGSAGSLKM